MTRLRGKWNIRLAAMAACACALAMAAAAQTPEAAPRRAGTVRIGLVQPRVDMGAGANNPGDALRALISRYVAGPRVEIVPLEAALPIQAEVEAQEKECNYVLYTSLTQKAEKKGGFGMLKGARAMSGMVPVVGMSGRTGAVVAQTAIGVAAEASAGVKAKNEVSFEYRLIAPGATVPAAANAEKIKAEADGQDVVTPMVEHAAAAIVGAAAR